MAYDAEVTTIKVQLERAKDAIRKHGHVKLTISGPQGELCTWGAIAVGAGAAHPPSFLDGQGPAHNAVQEQLKREGFGHICTWNNRPQTTADDVIALFDRTIASL